jgi:hypothetical protein
MKTWTIKVSKQDAFEFEVEAETEDEALTEASCRMIDVEPEMVAVEVIQ